MPYGNANEQTEELLKTHILAHSGSTPVVAGVFSADPSMSLRTRLERLQNLGVEGVTNWQAIGFISGPILGRLDASALGTAFDLIMLSLASQMVFTTFDFYLTH